jgi:hypothetical protein
MSEPKQPWEGIDGSDRESLLLSLEDEATEHREALMRMAKHLRTACLVGNRAPIVTSIWDRISKPEPGDLVVEMSRAVYQLDYQGFGILLACRREWPETDAEWEASDAASFGPDNRGSDDYWYVQYGNGHRDIARWENCEFMALPVGVTSWR